MMRHQPWCRSELLLMAMFVLGSVLATVTTASAHAGHTDPNAVHACVNRVSGLTRIVGAAGVCTASEDALHWGLVGPQGIQGPPGLVASFDDLEGLPCTRDGAVGTIEITYTANGDATLRCLLSQPPPPPTPDLTGTWSVSPAIQFSCASEVNITSFAFTLFGSTLQVDSTPVHMTGIASGNTFSVQGSRSVDLPFPEGSVTEMYSLSGVFDPDTDTWSGTFQARFSVQGGLRLCADRVFPNLLGTRQ